jgi:hypothetical protein
MRHGTNLVEIERIVAAHLAEWDPPHVELAIHGSGDAGAIARSLDDFCRAQLDAGIAHALFYRSSIGAVAGVQLHDGRRVVVKAHQPDRSRTRLEEIVRLQNHLAAHGGLAPRVVAGPAPLGRGLALAEELVERGTAPDAHQPAMRRALAVSFHAVIGALDPFVAASSLPSQLLPASSASRLWPTPHSRLFDFEATRAGAADIDALATAARDRMAPAGRIVLGHGDWRAEHVRFEGERAVVAYDWDSLCTEREPALVGITAHAFCADWSRQDYVQAPTVDEARAFVADYEHARGAPLDREERRLCGAAFAYAVAYTARCQHALGVDERRRPHTFQHLVAAHGVDLLRW